MLHALLDTTQVLGTFDIEGDTFEVCAEAVANHDRKSNQLTVELKAFLRSEKQDHIGETSVASWLPQPQTVVEHVEASEAHALASDVFSSWRGKVGAALAKARTGE